MEIEQTSLPGVVILTAKRFADQRGFFSEVYNLNTFSELGFDQTYVQDNHSKSVHTGTVRGLHMQTPPHAQEKLVRCAAGHIYDVVVDIRAGSPTYGNWLGVDLTPENGQQLLVPVGFLHGFVTRAPNSELFYKCSDVYAPDCDRSVYFADSDIGIDWGISTDEALLSDKDAAAIKLSELDNPFVYEG